MIIFVDVDDTIVRSFGTKRIPIPCFVRLLPKPDVSIDDQAFADWHHLREVHPSQVQQLLD
jgi:hypothetical protein